MDVNGFPTSQSGFNFSYGSDFNTSVPSLKRVLPAVTNDLDIGSNAKRVKCLYYTTLDPIPGGGVGGPFLALDGSTTMAGDVKLNGNNVTNFGTLMPVNGVKIGGGMTRTLDPVNSTTIGNGCVDTTTGAGLNVMVGYQASCLTPGTSNNTAIGALAEASGNSGATALGYGSYAIGQDSLALGRSTQARGLRSVTIGGNGANNTVANTVLFGDTNLANIRPNSTICDLGTAALPFQTLYLSGNVAGPTNSRAADDIVSNTGASTANRIAVFSGTTGKLITDGGSTIAQLLALSGGTMTGTITLGANNITGTSGSTITGGVFAGLATTDSTTTTTGAITTAGGIGVVKAITAGGVIKTTDSSASTSTSTGSIITSGGIGAAKDIRSGSIVAGTRFEASAPSLYTAWTTNQAASIAFTASTNKLIDIPGFTEGLDPAGEWTLTTTTGKCTYTGTSTRYFKIDILFNVAPPASNQILWAWVSKNSSIAAIRDSVLIQTGAAPSTQYMPILASNVYQLATNDTVQLVMQTNASVSVTFRDCLITITPIC